MANTLQIKRSTTAGNVPQLAAGELGANLPDNTLYVGQDANTKLLIHSDNVDGSSTFTDASPSEHTITKVGDPEHKATQKKFGKSSIHFDGNDRLSIASHADWGFGTGDFTVDCWVNKSATVAWETFVDTYSYVNNGFICGLKDSDSTIAFYSEGGTGWNYAGGTALALNTWYHLAWVRDGNNFRMFVDGVQQGSTFTFSSSDNYTEGQLIIGSRASAQYINGYMDEVRVSKGIARWTSNFTPPTRRYGVMSPEPTGDHLPLSGGTLTGDLTIGGDTYIYNNKALNILDSGGQRSLMITNFSSPTNSPYFSADPDNQAANTKMYWHIDGAEKMSLDSGGALSVTGALSGTTATFSGLFKYTNSAASNGTGDLKIIPSASATGGVGYATQIIGVNIADALSNNFPKQLSTWGGVTGSSAIALNADDNSYGQFMVLTAPQSSSANTELTPRFWITGAGAATFSGNLTVTGAGVAKQISANAYSTADFNNWYTGHFTFGQLSRYNSTHGHWRDSSNNVAANAPDTPTSPLTSTAPHNTAAYAYGGLLTLGSTDTFRGQMYMTHSGSELYWRSGWGASSDQNWVRLVNDRNIPLLLAASALTSATFSGAVTAGAGLNVTGNITGTAFGPIVFTSSTQSIKWPNTSGQANSRSWGWIGEQGSYGFFQLYRSDASDGTLDTEVLRFDKSSNATFYGALTGTTATFTGLTLTGSIDLQDNDKLLLGAGNDLEIYHDGTNNHIVATNGQLFINKNGASNAWIHGPEAGFVSADGSEYMIRATANGQVKLYYDNASKLQTVTGGVNVSGTLTAGHGDFNSLRTDYHFSKSFAASFANGTANLVGYISFGNSDPWGWIEVTLTGSFSHTNITGRYTKRFQIGRNASNAIHHQNAEVIASLGDIAAKFKIGAFEVSGSTLRLPIYSLTSAGNNVQIFVEGHTHTGATNATIVASLSCTTPVAVSNTETRDYLSLMTSRLGIGQASPAYELDVSGNANITGTLTAGGHVEFNSTFHIDVNGAGSDASFLMHNSNNAHLNFLSGNSAGGHDGDNPGNTLIDFRKTRDFLIGASDNTGLSNRANYLTIAGNTGNIGIGGVAPLATSRLYVNNTINSGTAIYGYTTAGTGSVYGIYAQANSGTATTNIGLGAAANSESTTNIAGEFYAVSATNNYSIKTLGGDVWIAGGGAVGIGTADAGTYLLYVAGTTYLGNDVTIGAGKDLTVGGALTGTSGDFSGALYVGGALTVNDHITANTNNVYNLGAVDKFFKHCYLYYVNSSTVTTSTLTVSGTSTLNADVNVAGDIGVANGRGVRGPSATESMILHTTDGVKFHSGGNTSERLRLNTDGTHDHKGNSIVNSRTVQGLQDGACYDFDGNVDYIQLASDGRDGFSSQHYTVSGWVKLKPSRQSDSVIFSYDHTSHTNPHYAAQVRVGANGSMFFGWNDGSTYKGFTSSAGNFTDDTWHHFACTHTSGTQKIYVDGVQVAAAAETGTITFYEQEVYIGRASDTGSWGGGAFFEGSMRAIQYFPSAFTAGEVAKLYSGENPKKNLGVELVINGTFADLTGWTSNVSGTSTITYQNNKAKLNDRASSACDLRNTAAIPTVSGKWYLARATFGGDRSNNGGAGSWFKWQIGPSTSDWSSYHDPGYGASGDGGSHGGDRFAYFKATGTTAYIKFTNGGDAGYVTVEKVSIQEVGTMVDLNPQSVSPATWHNEANLMLNGTVFGASASGGNSAWGNITQDRYGDVSFPSKVRIGDVSESMFGNQYPLVVKESGMSYLLLDGSDDNKAGIVYRTNVAGACGNKEWVIGSTQWQDNDGDLRFTWHRPCAGTDHVLRLTQGGSAIFGGPLSATTGAFSGAITVTADNSWIAGIHSKNTNADSSPSYMTLEKISASPANGDYIGGIVMKGRTSTGIHRNYVEQWCVATNVTNGSESGKWNCGTWRGGVEYPNTLVCAGNRVGIGTAPASGVILDVRDSGDANTKQYLINTGQTTAGRETEYIFGKDNGTNLTGTLKYYYHTTQASRRIDLLHYGTNAGLTILNNGRIGVNTTSPGAMLELIGGSVNGTTQYPGISGKHGSTQLYRLEQWYGNEGFLGLYHNGTRTVQFRGGESSGGAAPSYINTGNGFALGATSPGSYLFYCNGTANFTGALTVSGTANLNGAVMIDGGNGYFVDGVGNSYNTGWDSTSDDHSTWINFYGYQGGTTKFRDLRIGDGKNGLVALFDGSSKATSFSGAVSTGALTATTGDFSGLIMNDAGHGTARMQLRYWPSNDSWKGTLTMWVSEPGITYHDAGIGANIHSSGQYYGRQIDNGWGVYARFSKLYGTFEVWNTQGFSGTAGGQGTKRLEVNSGGHLTLPTGGITAAGSVEPTVANTYDLGSSTNTWRNLHLKGTAAIDSTLTVGGVITNHEGKNVSMNGFASNEKHTFYVDGDSDKFYKVSLQANWAQEIIVWRNYNETVDGHSSDWNNDSGTHFGAMTLHATLQTNEWGGHQKMLTGWLAQHYTNIVGRVEMGGGAEYQKVNIWLRGGAGGSGAGAQYNYTIRGGSSHAGVTAVVVDYNNSLGNADAFVNFVGDVRYINPHGRKHFELETTSNINCGGELNVSGSSTLTGAVIASGPVHISPDTAGKDTIRLTTNAANDGSILIKSDTTMKVDIQANGSTYFNGGNVGIGTSPSYQFHVETGANEVGFAYGSLVTGSQTIKFNPSSTKAGGTSKIYSSYAGTGATEGKLALGTYSAQTALVIDGGKVGIGIDEPAKLLHVKVTSGTAAPVQIQGYSDASTPKLLVLGTASYPNGTLGLTTISGHGYLETYGAMDLHLRPNQSTGMVVKSGGNVGIGADPGTYKLYVNGNSYVNGAHTTSLDLTCLQDLNVTGDAYITGDLDLTKGIVDKNSSTGTSGQVLHSDGDEVYWGTDDTGGGGGSGDITSVIGNTGISVSGGTSGDATVQLDVLGSDSCVNVHTSLTTPAIDDYMIVTDESVSNDPVRKCKIRYLPLAKSSTFYASGCGGTLYMHNPNGTQQDSTSISLTCGGSSS